MKSVSEAYCIGYGGGTKSLLALAIFAHHSLTMISRSALTQFKRMVHGHFVFWYQRNE